MNNERQLKVMTIYKVGYFNLSTLIIRKGSIFLPKNTREESCIILRGKKLVTLNLTLKHFLRSFVGQIKFFKWNAPFFIAYSSSIPQESSIPFSKHCNKIFFY